MKQPTDDIKNIHKKLCELKSKSKILAIDIEILENELKTFIDESTGIEGIATWKTQIRKSFDQVSLKLQHPEIYNQFSKEKTFRVFRLLNTE